MYNPVNNENIEEQLPEPILTTVLNNFQWNCNKNASIFI